VSASEWAEVAEHAQRSFPATAPHFHELHALMAWAAAGDWAIYERRLAELRTRAADGRLSPGAVIPALGEGFGAFVRGDYAAAARAMEPYVDDICRCGGSRAQQDVWEETLVAAWIRGGEAEKAARLLEQRVAQRPSPRATGWLTRARTAA
jgi:hypothetical protein